MALPQEVANLSVLLVLPAPLHFGFEKEVKVHFIFICLEVKWRQQSESTKKDVRVRVRRAPWQRRALGAAEGDCAAVP